MPERVEDVAIFIDGERWRAWSNLQIQLIIDGLSTVSFAAPFEPERTEFRDTFQPFTYKSLVVLVDDELLFTGTLVDVSPSTVPDSRTVQCQGYARPGVLLDCSAPRSAWPLELNGLKLSEIATRLLDPFEINVRLDADEGAVFRRVALRPGDTIHGFLSTLAKQRGLILSNTAGGALRIFQSSSNGNPVARFIEGQPPLMAVAASFSPQAYFSEITGQARARAGRGGSGFTVQNEQLADVIRPHTFTLEDTDDADAPTATEAKLGRMFGNVLSVVLELPTWRDSTGTLWSPDTTVMLEAPGAMIYRETEFLIRSVTLRQDAAKLSSALQIVLPGAFSGEQPEELPWT